MSTYSVCLHYYYIAPDKILFSYKKSIYTFSYFSMKIYVVGTH